MSFLETPRFPTNISFGSRGGPGYATDVLILSSGQEARDIGWESARHRYDVGYGIRKAAQLESLIAFFHAVQGRGHGFRYKDPLDFNTSVNGIAGPVAATDVQIGVGDGTTASFQLVKIYTTGALSRTRPITKPVSGTLRAAVDGVVKTEGVHFNVDYTTGILTFTGGNIPLTDEVITWGGEFDVPCRFDTDELAVNLDYYRAGSAQVPIVEIPIP